MINGMQVVDYRAFLRLQEASRESTRSIRLAALFVSVLVLSLDSVTSALAQPPSLPTSCVAVRASLRKLQEQGWVHLKATVESGIPWERYKTMESLVLDGRRQLRIVDGVHFGPRTFSSDDKERAIANGAAALEPVDDCQYEGDERLNERLTSSFRYRAYAERGDAWIRLWVDQATGLPIRAKYDGPVLEFARSLSRPGKPPQVSLRDSGRRYIEWQVFRFGKASVNSVLAGE